MGEEFIVIILLGIVGLFVLIPLTLAVINSKDTDDDDSDQRTHRATYPRRQSPSSRDWEEESKRIAFWSKAYHYIKGYVTAHDIDSAYEMMMNVWEDKDHVLYAKELHQLLDQTIEMLYEFRHVDACKSYILELGTLALSIYEEAKRKSDYIMCTRYPNRMAIILEKDGRIEEALALSEECFSRGIQDYHIGKTFESRIVRLKKKIR